ncbi:hypothetical protein VAE308_1240017 [Vibrio aestuarianus]|nr:hypothetical protein VAE308_1240017 [Vibrio aestuarianus]CAH8236760.1 hypothetical protein VAE016_410576 [Vibrio aestuarianus]
MYGAKDNCTNLSGRQIKDTARKAMKRIALKESANYQGIDAGSTY